MPMHPHGGECCGIWHIHGLDEYDKQSLKQKTERMSLGLRRQRKKRSILVEVVAAGCQIREWHNDLLDIGYVPVSEFYNVNTSRKIRVYHYYIPTGQDINKVP